MKWFLGLVLGTVLISYGLEFVNAYIQQIVVLCFIGIILSTSLNLINGMTGQFSLGHAGFMAVGAYSSAWLAQTFHPFSASLYWLNFPLYALCGGLVAAGFGVLVGLPSLRLRGDYLAIVTLGFGEIIRVGLLNLEAVGGARGMSNIAFIPQTILSDGHIVMWALVTVFLISRLMKMNRGRNFLAVRENEIAAESLGLNTTLIKVQAFVISSFFAGAAGSLFAHFTGNLNPSIFQFIKSVDVVIMVVLGGMGSLSGSILGAILVTVLPELLRPLQTLIGYDLRMIIYSLLLIGLMLLRPRGLLGNYASR